MLKQWIWHSPVNREMLLYSKEKIWYKRLQFIPVSDDPTPMAPSSSLVQDNCFSGSRRGFKSRWGYIFLC